LLGIVLEFVTDDSLDFSWFVRLHTLGTIVPKFA